MMEHSGRRRIQGPVEEPLQPFRNSKITVTSKEKEKYVGQDEAEREEEGEEEYYEVEDESQVWESRRLRTRYISEEYAVRMPYVEDILNFFNLEYSQVHEAFASDQNHRFPTWWTKKDNSFLKHWKYLQIWANPPWSLLDKVVLKLICDQVQCVVLIVPVWVTAPW